ncbi:hypothetical protein PF004_g7787 [Phytophthora fragariae]|uniref:Uncharacterized protein n=1 Tax=Phytophthora fragariae TaxID=53985 RepID=A0A6G0P932_9STRA|nr:hypothetical protein PF004_g7787 [Phytophthora fragariae]
MRTYITTFDCRKTHIAQMADPIPFVQATWFVDDR